MTALLGQMKLEAMLWTRRKETMFWTLAFPVFFILLFGTVWKNDTWNGAPTISYLLPGITVMALMMTCVVSTASWVVEEREKGIYRRLSLTPLSAYALLGGQIGIRYVVVLLQAAVLIAIGVGLFGADVSGSALLFLAVLTLGVLSFLSVGFLLTVVARSAKSAQPLAMIVLFILMFLGGCFYPLDVIPAFLVPLCHALPSTRLCSALGQVAIGGMGPTAIWEDLLVLGAWFVACSAVTVRFFRWE